MMMKYIKYSCCLLIAMFMTACTDDDTVSIVENKSISLSAKVVTDYNIESRTRATVTKDEAVPYRGEYPADAPFTANILLSNTNGVYDNNPVAPTYLPIHTAINFDQNTAVFPNKYNGKDLKYPDDDSNIYCVCMYPADDIENNNVWNISDDKRTATHLIDGETDLMFAPQITGKKLQVFPQQTFHHLLTWLRLCIYANSVNAVKNWGDIEYIKIKSKKYVSLDLSKTKADLSDTDNNAVSYIDIDNANVSEGDNPDTDYFIYPVVNHTLTTTFAQVGSVFCSPSLSYTIHVKTKNMPAEKVITVQLANEDGTAITNLEYCRGKVFVLELEFDTFNTIESKCVLNDWEVTDEDLYDDATQS